VTCRDYKDRGKKAEAVAQKYWVSSTCNCSSFLLLRSDQIYIYKALRAIEDQGFTSTFPQKEVKHNPDVVCSARESLRSFWLNRPRLPLH